MNDLFGGNHMKNRLLILILTVAVAFSGMAGFSSYVRANDDEDGYAYSFYNANKQGHSCIAYKTTPGTVYIHPTSGPALKYTVQGNNGSTWNSRSNTHTIYAGTKASFVNSLNSHNETECRIQYKRTGLAYTTTYGYWNPNPLNTYTMYN